MDFQEVVRKRRMVRSFLPTPLPAEAVDRILRNAQRAPSAGFSQGWAFLALETDEDRDRYWDTAWPDRAESPWPDLFDAPLLVVCLSHKDAYLDRYTEPDKGWIDRDEARWPAPYWDIDTGMAAMLMLLTAVDEGLGGLFFGVPPESHEDVHETFAIPHDRDIVGVVAIGHPLSSAPGSPSRRPRRPLSEVAHAGRFGTPYVPA